MQEPERLISLGLTTRPATTVPVTEILPPAETLQFRRAEYISDSADGPQCVSCKKSTGTAYFQANGQVVCPPCAARIESTQKAASPRMLVKALLYGMGAAMAGSLLYAAVAITTGLQLSILSLLIGYMVAKAIRRVSGGGRPQQVMAVALTYLSMTTSYIPVVIYRATHSRSSTAGALHPEGKIPSNPVPARNAAASGAPRTPATWFGVFGLLLWLAIAAPFLAIRSGAGILTIFIIFMGMFRAWRMTSRPHVLVMGPYQAPAAA